MQTLDSAQAVLPAGGLQMAVSCAEPLPLVLVRPPLALWGRRRRPATPGAGGGGGAAAAAAAACLPCLQRLHARSSQQQRCLARQ
jgi:hypothetical protein